MNNDEASPFSKTPVDNDYRYGPSRRSSTTLSIVGVGGTPADLQSINVYEERALNSPISPAVHPRCRTTTGYTTTPAATTDCATQCSTTECPGPPMRTECTPMCAQCSPCQKCSPSHPLQPSPPYMSASPAKTKSPERTTRATQYNESMMKSPTHSCGGTGVTTRSPFFKCAGSPKLQHQALPPTNKRRSPLMHGTATSPQIQHQALPSTETTQSPFMQCDGASPHDQCHTRSPSCPTRSPQCTARTTYITRSPCARATSQCSRGTSPQYPSTPIRSHSPTDYPSRTTATQCTPQSECSYSPGRQSVGIQSVDSEKGTCTASYEQETCPNKAHRDGMCNTTKDTGCPLEVCKIRSGLHKSPTGSICTSPQSSKSNASSANNTKRVPFPSKRADDEYAGGVVRWTEKCSHRCNRPTWNANRWNCDKPAPRNCTGCPGAHPIPSRCAQDYDAQRFIGIEGIKPRKCDCCDRRYNKAMLPGIPPAHPHSHAQFQHHNQPAPLQSCGCDGYPRGVNHIRRSQPPMMPQNPFDNNSSAYFNRLNKGIPFPIPPPPPNQAPAFNTMPPAPPFNPQFNPPAPPPPPPPPAPAVNTVTTRDSALNIMQNAEEFPSPLKAYTNHCLADQDGPLDQSPDDNVNMVSNPHMFNTIFLPRNPNHPMPTGMRHNYIGQGQKYP